MKLHGFALEAVCLFVAAPRLCTREPDLGRQIENEGDVRLEIADRDALESIDERRINIAERALIDPRRIHKTIADHPAATFKRRLDGVADVVVTRCCEQDCLGMRSEWFGRA